jgi:hypothetical protein
MLPQICGVCSARGNVSLEATGSLSAMMASPSAPWMIDIIVALRTDGPDAVETACAEALLHNVHSSGVRHGSRTYE